MLYFDTCDYEAPTNYNLQGHIDQSILESDFLVVNVNMKGKKDQLENHLGSRHGNFRCNTCDYVGASKSNVREHMANTHNNLLH